MPATMQVEPYLFFDGRCEEALEFYRGALGAEVPGTDAVDQDLHIDEHFGSIRKTVGH